MRRFNVSTLSPFPAWSFPRWSDVVSKVEFRMFWSNVPAWRRLARADKRGWRALCHLCSEVHFQIRRGTPPASALPSTSRPGESRAETASTMRSSCSATRRASLGAAAARALGTAGDCRKAPCRSRAGVPSASLCRIAMDKLGEGQGRLVALRNHHGLSNL